MKRSKDAKKFLDSQPTTPSEVLLAARLASGAGAHGGGHRAERRRGRQAEKRRLKKRDFDE